MLPVIMNFQHLAYAIAYGGANHLASYTLQLETRFFCQRMWQSSVSLVGVGAYNAEGPVYPVNRSSPSSILSFWAVWRSGQPVSTHLAFSFLCWVQPGKAQIKETISVKHNVNFLSCVAIGEALVLVPFLGLVYRQKTLTNSFNSP